MLCVKTSASEKRLGFLKNLVTKYFNQIKEYLTTKFLTVHLSQYGKKKYVNFYRESEYGIGLFPNLSF